MSYGKTFLNQIIVAGFEWPYVENILKCKSIRAYVCPTCKCTRIWWLEEIRASHNISCKNKNCGGTMELLNITMKNAKIIPNVWNRIESLAACGY